LPRWEDFSAGGAPLCAVARRACLAVGVLVQIGVAQAGDIGPLREALGPSCAENFQSRFRLQIAGLGEILLAFRGVKPVGMVVLSWDLADEPEVRAHLAGVPAIFHLFVVPGLRHNGIGRRLLRAAEGRLRKHGFDRVLLGVDEPNANARALYQRLGYAPPAEPALRGLRAPTGNCDAYDILVADLHREPPRWE